MKTLYVAAAFALFAQGAVAGTISFVDTINDGTRTNFNGFEGASDTGGSNAPSYTEGGIAVNQINGEGNDIWTNPPINGREGGRSWYPNGGDYGYTSIMLDSGANFDSVGMLIGNGWYGNPVTVLWQLLDNGSVVSSGSYLAEALTYAYAAFSGGDFDEVQLKAIQATSGEFSNADYQALAVDSIETGPSGAVPLPAGFPLLAGGLAMLGMVKRRKRG